MTAMTDRELTARLLLALLFGALIGIERQWHHKNAGLKTNTLVALGAAAFAIVAERGFGPHSYLEHVAAGVVTGIGFIGGGVIMHRGGSVQGITTAATLWATASLGLAVGIGYYSLGLGILISVLIVQSLLRWGEYWIDQRSGLVTPLVTYRLKIHYLAAAAESVRKAWSDLARQPGIAVISYSETKREAVEGVIEASFKLSEAGARNLTALGQSVGEIAGVVKAEWSQATERGDQLDAD